jgi:hypothetical protein
MTKVNENGGPIMNLADKGMKLEQDFPLRSSGSTGMKAAIELISAAAKELGLEPELQSLPLYYSKTSVWVYGAGLLLGVLLGWFWSWIGLIVAGLFWLLFLLEPFYPLLSAFKSGATSNLIFTIPACGEETQKVLFLAHPATDRSFAIPDFFTCCSHYFITLVMLGFTVLALLAFHWGRACADPWFLFIPIFFVFLFNVLSRGEDRKPAPFADCTALLEAAAILVKTRPATTTSTFCFAGSNSLNSGSLGVPFLLKQRPVLTYLVNLGGRSAAEIRILNTEGFPFPKAGDAMLIEELKEVAAEKDITVTQGRITECAGAYPLLLRKFRTVSLACPEGVNIRNLRELLTGLVHKIDS